MDKNEGKVGKKFPLPSAECIGYAMGTDRVLQLSCPESYMLMLAVRYHISYQN